MGPCPSKMMRRDFSTYTGTKVPDEIKTLAISHEPINIFRLLGFSNENVSAEEFKTRVQERLKLLTVKKGGDLESDKQALRDWLRDRTKVTDINKPTPDELQTFLSESGLTLDQIKRALNGLKSSEAAEFGRVNLPNIPNTPQLSAQCKKVQDWLYTVKDLSAITTDELTTLGMTKTAVDICMVKIDAKLKYGFVKESEQVKNTGICKKFLEEALSLVDYRGKERYDMYVKLLKQRMSKETLTPKNALSESEFLSTCPEIEKKTISGFGLPADVLGYIIIRENVDPFKFAGVDNTNTKAIIENRITALRGRLEDIKKKEKQKTESFKTTCRQGLDEFQSILDKGLLDNLKNYIRSKSSETKLYPEKTLTDDEFDSYCLDDAPDAEYLKKLGFPDDIIKKSSILNRDINPFNLFGLNGNTDEQDVLDRINRLRGILDTPIDKKILKKNAANSKKGCTDLLDEMKDFFDKTQEPDIYEKLKEYIDYKLSKNIKLFPDVNKDEDEFKEICFKDDTLTIIKEGISKGAIATGTALKTGATVTGRVVSTAFSATGELLVTLATKTGNMIVTGATLLGSEFYKGAKATGTSVKNGLKVIGTVVSTKLSSAGELLVTLKTKSGELVDVIKAKLFSKSTQPPGAITTTEETPEETPATESSTSEIRSPAQLRAASQARRNTELLPLPQEVDAPLSPPPPMITSAEPLAEAPSTATTTEEEAPAPAPGANDITESSLNKSLIEEKRQQFNDIVNEYNSKSKPMRNTELKSVRDKLRDLKNPFGVISDDRSIYTSAFGDKADTEQAKDKATIEKIEQIISKIDRVMSSSLRGGKRRRTYRKRKALKKKATKLTRKKHNG